MQVKTSQALTTIATLLQARLVPFLAGSPGIGKSQIYQAVADKFNLELIDIRLGQCDLTDLCGFPQIQGNKAGYVPMDTFPIEGDALPEGRAGWMVLFDELSSAVPALQAAAYKIILDRKVGKYNLHKNVAVCAAGNLEGDNAVVHPMSTALQSRMVHLELVADAKEWVEWAASFGIDHRITSYINFKPSSLYTFTPDHTDNTYACPRTWAFADKIMKQCEVGDPDLLPMLAGALSEGVAREFLVFCKVYKDLPTIDSLVTSPETQRMPTEPSILYAMSGCISHNASTDNISQLIKYVSRMPVEFQIVTVRETLRRNIELKNNSTIMKWLATNAEALF